jgi:hypothetical protein
MAVYINLFHGRHSDVEEIDGWGYNGPVLGPFKHIHITYGQHIKTETNFSLGIDGFIKYIGSFYGDFSIFDQNSFDEDLNLKARWNETEQVLYDIKNGNSLLHMNSVQEWVRFGVELILSHKLIY